MNEINSKDALQAVTATAVTPAEIKDKEYLLPDSDGLYRFDAVMITSRLSIAITLLELMLSNKPFYHKE